MLGCRLSVGGCPYPSPHRSGGPYDGCPAKDPVPPEDPPCSGSHCSSCRGCPGGHRHGRRARGAQGGCLPPPTCHGRFATVTLASMLCLFELLKSATCGSDRCPRMAPTHYPQPGLMAGLPEVLMSMELHRGVEGVIQQGMGLCMLLAMCVDHRVSQT